MRVSIAKIEHLIILTRPYNAISGVLFFSIGYFIPRTGQPIGDYLTGVLVVFLLFAFAAVQNDIEDMDTDKINKPHAALFTNKLSLGEVKKFEKQILVLLLIVSLLASFIYKTPVHFGMALLGLAFSWVYNKPPFYASRKPVWSILILSLVYAGLTFVYGYLLHPYSAVKVIVAFLIAVLILRCSASLLKDYKDIEGDKKTNKKTFLLQYGFRPTAIFSMVAAVIGYAAVFYLFLKIRGLSIFLLFPLLAALVSALLRTKLFCTKDPEILDKRFRRILIWENYFELFFLACIILTR